MFHFKDFRRRNVSSSPYLSSRVLEPPSISPTYDAIHEHDSPAHVIHLRSPGNDNGYNFPAPQEDVEVEDILAPGDIVGKGSILKGDVVSLLPTDREKASDDNEDEHFQVIKELGKGSYAVVYLVRQVFFTPSPSSASDDAADSSEDSQILGHMDGDGHSIHHSQMTYGRKFAIKCLCKDKEALDLQMAEVTIHQSLPLHSNIVALHKTLQTSSYLLLVQEYVPGEDLFYFLEQARDHCPSPSIIHSFFPNSPTSDPLDSPSQQVLLQQQRTPPTPSLLSSLHPSHLLSRTRLRLVASMFAQMCDAVAACHAVGVFHRDIKPENFIVTDGRYLDQAMDMDRINGAKNTGRVVVKLTDFGLSTREEECSDMDCGSAPYMSYECRNNISPTYRPREADVWSLGIVLINMLYHTNPWTDTAHGVCPSFAAFRQDPVGFFMRLFTGMTTGFVEVLARRVFCIDDETRVNGAVKETRMTAAELGAWVRSNLVDLLAMDESVPSAASTARAVVNGGHRLSLQMRISHRPVSRAASPFGARLGSIGGVGGFGMNGGIGSTVTSPRILAMTLSRAPSLAPALEKEEAEAEAKAEKRSGVQVVEELKEQVERQEQEQGRQEEEEIDTSPPSRTSTATRKRKRGLRGKQQQQQDEALKTLADASQSLAREISIATKAPSIHQFQLQHHPSISTPTINHNHVNGDDRRTSTLTLSSATTGESAASGVTESGSAESSATVLTVATTVPPPSMMSMSTNTSATESSSLSLKSSDSTRTPSKGSSLRTAMTTKTTGASSGSSHSRASKRYEPVSMYALPSALLSRPTSVGEGGQRTPSRLSTSTGDAPSVGSGSGTQPQPQPQQQDQQPKAVVKKPSKWTLRFGKNNVGAGNNTSPATPAIPSASSSPAASAATPVPVTTTSASGLTSGQACALSVSRQKSRPIPIMGGPGHLISLRHPSGSLAPSEQAQTPAKTAPSHATMSPTVTNVTNVLMGLDPAPSQPPCHQSGSSGILADGDLGGGYVSPWSRGRRGRSRTGDSKVMVNGAGGGRSSYKPKSPSRSPGPSTVPGGSSRTGGFGSSASSSNASLISGAGSGVDQVQVQSRGHQDGWDKWSLDRMGMGNRGGGSSGGSGNAVQPPRVRGFGAGGGRHGSVGAAGGPFASALMGTGMSSSGNWRAVSATASSMSAMSINTNASGSMSAIGTASPGGSTSTFSRYSNSSVSTMATSVSSGSGMANWRNGGRGGAAVTMIATNGPDPDYGMGGSGKSSVGGKTNPYVGYPHNVKNMDGIPWALNDHPRSQVPNSDFGSPVKKPSRSRNKKGNNTKNDNNASNATSTASTVIDATTIPSTTGRGSEDNASIVTSKLDTIIERPGSGPTSDLSTAQEDATITTSATVVGHSTWKNASTSTSDLPFVPNPAPSDEGTGGRFKKVHKGQVNALAKMLSALRR